MAATRKGVTHRTVIAGTQCNGIKSAKTRVIEYSRVSGTWAKARALESTVEERVRCEGRRGARLWTHREMGVLNTTEVAEVRRMGVILTG